MQAFRRLALLARNGRNFSTTAVRRGGAAGEPGNVSVSFVQVRLAD